VGKSYAANRPGIASALNHKALTRTKRAKRIAFAEIAMKALDAQEKKRLRVFAMLSYRKAFN